MMMDFLYEKIGDIRRKNVSQELFVKLVPEHNKEGVKNRAWESRRRSISRDKQGFLIRPVVLT